MSGGLDILIAGVAGKSLDVISPRERLEEFFGNDSLTPESTARYVEDIHALEKDPTTQKPRIFYIKDENVFGSVLGEALGYVLFDGNLGQPPRQLDERLFARIPELKERFVRELTEKGIAVNPKTVGVYALNVADT